MYRIITVLLLFSFSSDSVAQSKDDIISILRAVSEVPDLDPLFQANLSGGPSLVFIKNDRLNSGANEVERNYFNLTNDDLWGFSRSVKIFTAREADIEGIRRDQMVSLGLSIAEDQCNAQISGSIEEGNRFLQGWVSLNKPGFDWVVTGKNIRTR